MTAEIVNVSGARGESFADIIRRVGSVGGVVVEADASDADVMDAFLASISLIAYDENVYATIAAGLAATASGSTFWVGDVNGLRLYRDNAGAEVLLATLAAGDDLEVDQMTLAEVFGRADVNSGNLILGSTASGSLLTNSPAGTHNGDTVTGLGIGVFSNATTAYASAAVGYSAAALLTTGASIWAGGYQALFRATTAEGVTATGTDAGYNVTTGSRMLIEGRHAMADMSGSTSFVGARGVALGETVARLAADWTDFVVAGCNAMSAAPASGSVSFVAIGANIWAKTSSIRSVGIGYDIMQSTNGVGARAATECTLVGARQLFGVQNAQYCSLLGAFAYFQSDGDTTTLDSVSGVGHGTGYLNAGAGGSTLGAFSMRRSTKQTIPYVIAIGYRAGDQSGSDYTPVAYDFIVANGPLAADRLLYGNTSTGLLSVKGQLNAGGAIKTATYTVGTLPAAATAGAGARAYVTDANSTTYRAAAVGGGANKVSVFSDGANWFLG